jgi:L-alanine-DL-glutamate epimerase-like enolase superfamily enzyme
MVITDVEVRHYRIPLKAAMTDSTHGEMTHFEVVMCVVACDGGTDGIGYTYTIGQGGAAIASLIERELRPVLVGEDPARIEHIWDKLWWRLHYVGRGGLAVFAISAVDIALWDLKGNRHSEPLWKLLGGHSGFARVYAGGIDLHLSEEDLLAQTRANLGEGFRAIKMKVGRDKLSEDVQRVGAVRECLGPDVPLMVDANMRWGVETAISAARQLREFDVYWLEEPTIPDDIPGHARIASEGGIPVATGENLHSIYEFQAMIENGRISYPEPDVSNIGGVTGWMRVARLAYARNLPVTTHGVHELHLQLLAAVPNASYLEVHGFGLERFMKKAPEITEGVMNAPDRPGHGVIFDWHRLEAHRVYRDA